MRRAALALLTATLPTLFACDNAGAPQNTTNAGHASRIVTLAPNLAELVFAVGAGDFQPAKRSVGGLDFPHHALELPQLAVGRLGHVGRAVVEVGRSLPFRFVLVDDRPEVLATLPPALTDVALRRLPEKP